MRPSICENSGKAKFRWTKLGHVYQPSGKLEWARTHAANPTAEHVRDDIFRIYFSARDDKNRSSIGSILIDLKNPKVILEEASDPVLGPGELGMFDDCGASIGCILRVGKARYLYYMGWNLAVTVPWKNALGLAISEAEGQPFERYSRFPVVPLDETDPYTISYPWVIEENGLFRMWYGSNLKWGPVKEDMQHVLKYAESKDGINWTRENRIVVDADYPVEYAMCRPTVLKDEDAYWMWFCSRGARYRIELAESKDGITWSRLGRDTGIDVSDSGWDEDMIEYPCVFEHKGRRYLLYCGAEYGKTGFGLAILDRN
jgi:predicted GH43/DUF377 family glycosyl hydrolase